MEDYDKQVNTTGGQIASFEKRISDIDEMIEKNVADFGPDFLKAWDDDEFEIAQPDSDEEDHQEEDEEEDDMEEDGKRKSRKRKSTKQLTTLATKKKKVAEAQKKKAPAKRNLSTRVSLAELKKINVQNCQYQATLLEESLKKLKPNFGAIKEYRLKQADYQKKLADLEAITKERNDCLRMLEALKKQRLQEFMAGFTQITVKLKEMYQMLTLGGDAELELVDSLDPFSEGIVFSVRPPRKAWKNISNLSGGEKTLSSLALVFALHHYKPSPLYVLDEIDAALDFKNVSIVANYIKDQAINSQFIIISLRNNMFELANRLVGIYKTRDVTSSVAVNPEHFLQQPDPETMEA
eukprot:TRINITY_DN19124_c0_g2_i1.p1 TRINITY_DN19124_c0_g2~~TRINITY_DN19124_c0_g2_i1.p1  ORF type:complete len:393 (+),score=95.38 TRINITY_DN19124_c0_g2_i1:129-1181(+)